MRANEKASQQVITFPRWVTRFASASLFAVALPAYAAETLTDNDGHFAASIYLWGAGLGGETTTGGDIDIGFDDLINNLDMTYMGTFELVKNKWLFAVDVLQLSISAGNDGEVKTPLGDIATSSSVDETVWIITPIAGYNLIEDSRGSLAVFGGARYASMDTTLELTAPGPLGRHYESSDESSVLDAIVGIRGRMNLKGHWYLPYYMDIGAGDTNLTWQAFGGVGYQFDRLSVNAGYRYLDWQLDDNKILDTLNISGPLVGVKYQF